MQLRGWMLCCCCWLECPHRAGRGIITASKVSERWPSESGFVSKINGATLANPAVCDYLVGIRSSCLKVEIAGNEARKWRERKRQG